MSTTPPENSKPAEKTGDYLILRWPFTDRFQIEAAMVRKGGYVIAGGIRYGHGPYYHFKAAMTALWPHFYWFNGPDPMKNWPELLIRTWVEETETGVMGPASTTKTYCAAGFALATFYIWPTGTSIIMSSTTREGLQLRIWGAVKELHNKAKARRAWLPGRIIESRYMLTGANSDDEAQDFRDGIIGVACFLPGTPVDTPSGPVSIENLNVGDTVISAIGPRKITATMRRSAPNIVRIHLSTGKHIDCTPNHRFLTLSGWQRAIDIHPNTYVLSPRDSLQIVREAVDPPTQEILRPSLQDGKLEETVPLVRDDVCATRAQKRLLLETLLIEISDVRPSDDSKDNAVKGLGHNWKESQRNPDEESRGERASLEKSVDVSLNQISKRELHRGDSNSMGVGANPSVSRSKMEIRRWNRALFETETDSPLLLRPSVAGDFIGCGGGRHEPQSSKGSRRQADSMAFGTRVDRVEILKPAGEASTYVGGVGYQVYNLQVEGHPSYSIHNVVVHNCRVGGAFVGISGYIGLKNDRVYLIADEASLMARGFLDSVANLRKNPIFKMIAMGNPKDRTDALGMVCEPHASIGGWEGLTQEEKTDTWRTRANGRAIQLCGYDSPNFRYPRGLNPWKGVITPEQIEADLAYYGKDSLQFSMMNLGIMPRDGGTRRVITAAFCEINGAREEAIWADSSKITHVLGLDAAYSGTGGDRCALDHEAFGPDVHGKVILAHIGMVIVPIKQGFGLPDPEEQIVRYVMAYAILHGIPPGRLGFDSTGRGSLASAFARIWSPDVVAIEFGGQPDKERKVREESSTANEKHKIPTEAEAYGKKVTALWWASRLIIESKQQRQLPLEVIEDGACREWGTTKSGKTDVEEKAKTKERMGRSPDLWDARCCAIEVARRNGFKIAAGLGVGISRRTVPHWLKDMQTRQKKLREAHSLTLTT